MYDVREGEVICALRRGEMTRDLVPGKADADAERPERGGYPHVMAQPGQDRPALLVWRNYDI